MEDRKRQTQMLFPLSRSLQSRRLILRNTTDVGFLVKLVSSSASLLQFSPLSVNQRSVYHVAPNSFGCVKISLDQSQLSDADWLEMEHLQMKVYCIKLIFSRDMNRLWIRATKHPESELVQKFSIVRTKSFSALQTVVDLPGQAHFISAVLRPSMDVDESDCITAHRVESDADTMISLTDKEALDVLPPTSMLDTARQPPTSLFSSGFCSWMSHAMSLVFPAPGKDVATPPAPPNSREN